MPKPYVWYSILQRCPTRRWHACSSKSTTPTQENGQGPDLGDQYRSEIFYTSPAQQATAERLIAELRRKGYDVVTQVTPAGRFWPAEDYHQRYYERKGTQPYCHAYTKRF